MNDNAQVRLEHSTDGRISFIVIDRPEKRNALSPDMLETFERALADAIEGPSRLIVVRSAVPGVFSAGADFAYLDDDERLDAILLRCADGLVKADKTTIAVSDGLTIGGGLVLFLACDLRVATRAAAFRMPPVKLARVFEFDGVARFVRTIGLTAATEMLLTARRYEADEALRCGLVTRLVDTLDEGFAYCRDAAECPPHAQAATKAMLRMLGEDLARTDAGRDGPRLAALIEAARTTADRREAVAAFRERRPPVFTGT